MKVKENWMVLKLNETHPLLVYANDVNLLGDNIDTIKKNTESIIDTSKEAGLEESTERTKCKLMSSHQNAGTNLNIKTENRSFEHFAKFKYLLIKATNQNLIH
jgi:hypothetical protein